MRRARAELARSRKLERPVGGLRRPRTCANQLTVCEVSRSKSTKA